MQAKAMQSHSYTDYLIVSPRLGFMVSGYVLLQEEGQEERTSYLKNNISCLKHGILRFTVSNKMIYILLW